MAVQLRLLSPPRPLVNRLGVEFFRAIPKAPGVYRMLDRAEAILYIGQSKNLRQRLNSYRYIESGRASRRLVRLVHSVERITYDVLASADDARLRENALLRTLRPRFNRAQTWPRSRFYVWVERRGNALHLGLTQTPTVSAGDVFGAFKGNTRGMISALLRILWHRAHGYTAPDELPHRLSAATNSGQGAVEFPSPESAAFWHLAVLQFLSGSHSEFATLSAVEEPRATSSFERAWLAQDYETLADFFVAGPQRNLQLREKFALEEALLSPEMLDDFSIRAGSGKALPVPETIV